MPGKATKLLWRKTWRVLGCLPPQFLYVLCPPLQIVHVFNLKRQRPDGGLGSLAWPAHDGPPIATTLPSALIPNVGTAARIASAT